MHSRTMGTGSFLAEVTLPEVGDGFIWNVVYPFFGLLSRIMKKDIYLGKLSLDSTTD